LKLLMKESLQEFETLLLIAIGELAPEAYGLAIHQHLESATGRSLALGQIYTGLARLEQRGLIVGTEGQTAPGRAGRARKFYRLEPGAVRVLKSTAAAYSRLAHQITSALPRFDR
jgi:DNA-binding PadR family transcriptional regulator